MYEGFDSPYAYQGFFIVHPLNHSYYSICNVVSHGSFDLCFLDG